MNKNNIKMPNTNRHAEFISASQRSRNKRSATSLPIFDSGMTALCNEKGRSMVEMLGVLAVIGVLSAGALAGYSQAMKKHKLNETTSQIVQIMSNIRTKFAHKSRATELTMQQAIELGIFPEDMVQSATEVANKYQGTVKLETVTVDGRKVYKLSFDGLPDDVAAQLATADWGKNGIVKLILNEAEE